MTSLLRACYCFDALSFSSAASARRRYLSTTTANILANRRALSLSSSSSSSSSSLILQKDGLTLVQTKNNESQNLHNRLPPLQGDWINAKSCLRDPNCCVVHISNIQQQISILQQYFCGEDAHSDLDLRMKVRGCRSLGESGEEDDGVVYHDCESIYNAVMMGTSFQPSMMAMDDSFVTSSNDNYEVDGDHHRCIVALTELARGMASLVDGRRLTTTVSDVHVRVVCASNYAANDPLENFMVTHYG